MDILEVAETQEKRGITRRKVIIALLVLLALAVFLPPNINGVRFRDRLAGSLSSALGRKVKIGQVKYRVFPRPGFDVYDLQVMDDPAFSPEPLLTCGKVTADLRLASLWQGRLEIANLKLSDDASPASLNLVYSKGHWNLESLLVRVEQVPSAPTSRLRAEERPRFPYIAATAGRINLKIEAEKKAFAITNTDFAFWLASEDQWHVRLEGRPVRTDMNLNDTGVLRLEGDLRRSRELRDMPVKLDLAWEKAQLGQFSSLLLGQDRGWRGGLSASAQLTGTPANLHITGSADLTEFRRFDINRNQMPRLRTRCLGDYVRSQLDLKCDTPLDTGGVLLTAKWLSSAPRDYDLSVVATRVPLSLLATVARHARKPLPDDLTATGDLSAAFGFHSRNGVRNWHGTGMTSPFLLQSAVVEKPFAVNPVRFHIGLTETPTVLLSRKARRKDQLPPPAADMLTFDAFSIQLGSSTTAEVQATVDTAGYWVGVKGLVPLERLLALGRVAGFASDIKDTTASAIVDLNISGPWANFAPARVRGTAHLQNVTSWIPGIKDRLVLTEADAQISEVELVLAHIKGQFEHTPIAFTGTVHNPWSCGGVACPLEFDLHSDSLNMADIGTLLGTADKGWNLPFFSGGSSKLPDFRATGTFSAGEFTVAQVPLEKFTAQIEVSDKSLTVSHINARLGGGSTEGDWRVDWSSATPRFTATGNLSGVALDKVNPLGPDAALITSWVTGRADIKYDLRFQGPSPRDMASSSAGRIDYTVANGSSRALALDGSKPLKFSSLQGAAELEKQNLKVLSGKFRTENRIYDLSGTVSLADKMAKLRLSSSNARWEITGALEKPQIAGPPPSARTTAARSR